MHEYMVSDGAVFVSRFLPKRARSPWEAVQTLARRWHELETEEVPPPEWHASQGWIEVPGPLRSIWWRRVSEEERTLAVRGSGTLCLWGAES